MAVTGNIIWPFLPSVAAISRVATGTHRLLGLWLPLALSLPADLLVVIVLLASPALLGSHGAGAGGRGVRVTRVTRDKITHFPFSTWKHVTGLFLWFTS